MTAQTFIMAWAAVGLIVAIRDGVRDRHKIGKLMQDEPLPPVVLSFCIALGLVLSLIFNLHFWPYTVYVNAKEPKQ